MTEDKNKFEDFIDAALKDDNFREINKIIGSTVETAIDITKGSIANINKALKREEPNEKYELSKDDSIINQRPKSISRVKGFDILYKVLLVLHFFPLFVFVYDSSLKPLLLYFIPVILLCIFGLYKNHQLKKQIIRFRKYKREIGNQPVIPVNDLAIAVGESKEFTIKDLKELIKKDFFRQARFVEDNELFILDAQTFKLYKNHINNEEYTVDLNDDYDENKSKNYIAELADLAEQVEEPLKTKIINLLKTIRKIFATARQNPQTRDDLNRFVDYYLPTTVKLAKSYRDMKKNSSLGATKESLREIETAMDTVNYAYLRLLDNMYEDTVMDISSDISVLKNMLEQEGLLDQGGFNGEGN